MTSGDTTLSSRRRSSVDDAVDAITMLSNESDSPTCIGDCDAPACLSTVPRQDSDPASQDKLQEQVLLAIEHFCGFISKFNTDAAKEDAEKYKSQWMTQVDSFCRTTCFCDFVSNLALLAASERGYINYSFLHTKTSFLRREVSVKDTVRGLSEEFLGLSEQESSSCDGRKLKVFCHLAAQAALYCHLRVSLMDIYECLSQLTTADVPQFADIIFKLEESATSCKMKLIHPIFTALQSHVLHESELLLAMLKCAEALKTLKFIQAITHLKSAKQELDAWMCSSDLAAAPVKKQSTWFGLGKSQKSTPEPVVVQWLSLFYNHLWMKATLLFHDLLQNNVEDFRKQLSKAPDNLQGRIVSFVQKHSSAVVFVYTVCAGRKPSSLVLGYVHPDREKLSESSSLNNVLQAGCSVGAQVQGKILCYFSAETGFAESPRLAQVFVELTSRVSSTVPLTSSISDNKVALIQRVESNTFVAVVTSSQKIEKDATLFLSEFVTDLKLGRCFSMLRMPNCK